MRNAGADCLPVRRLLFLLFLGGVGSAQLLSVLSRAFLHGGDELLGAALARLNYVVNGELDLLRLQLHAEHLGKDTMQRYDDRVNQPPVKEVHPAREPVRQRHDDQVEEDNGQGEVETLDSFLDDVSLRKYNNRNVKNVGDYCLRPIPFFGPVEGCSAKDLRTVRSQPRHQVHQNCTKSQAGIVRKL